MFELFLTPEAKEQFNNLDKNSHKKLFQILKK
jgi:hypothetical protein